MSSLYCSPLSHLFWPCRAPQLHFLSTFVQPHGGSAFLFLSLTLSLSLPLSLTQWHQADCSPSVTHLQLMQMGSLFICFYISAGIWEALPRSEASGRRDGGEEPGAGESRLQRVVFVFLKLDKEKKGSENMFKINLRWKWKILWLRHVDMSNKIHFPDYRDKINEGNQYLMYLGYLLVVILISYCHLIDWRRNNTRLNHQYSALKVLINLNVTITWLMVGLITTVSFILSATFKPLKVTITSHSKKLKS